MHADGPRFRGIRVHVVSRMCAVALKLRLIDVTLQVAVIPGHFDPGSAPRGEIAAETSRGRGAPVSAVRRSCNAVRTAGACCMEEVAQMKVIKQPRAAAAAARTARA